MNKVESQLVTLGLTTYNSLDTVERALKSLLNQAWSNVEVIVVDDCSVDGTHQFLENYPYKGKNVRIISHSVNYGVAVSRNRIIDEAKGEFLAFFDDDDVSHPQRIKEQYKRIVEYELDFAGNAPVICHTARQVVYPNGEIKVQSTMGQIEGRSAPAGRAVAARILMGEPLRDGYGACPTCSQMARLSTYKLIGGFDPQLRRGEDTDLNIRLAQVGGHFVGVSKPMVIQTMTPTPEKSLVEEYRNMRLLMEKHQALMERAGKYNFCLSWLGAKHTWLMRMPVAFIQQLALLVLKHPVLTVQRLLLALPNISLNLAFSRFHSQRDGVGKLSSRDTKLDGL